MSSVFRSQNAILERQFQKTPVGPNLERYSAMCIYKLMSLLLWCHQKQKHWPRQEGALALTKTNLIQWACATLIEEHLLPLVDRAQPQRANFIAGCANGNCVEGSRGDAKVRHKGETTVRSFPASLYCSLARL